MLYVVMLCGDVVAEAEPQISISIVNCPVYLNFLLLCFECCEFLVFHGQCVSDVVLLCFYKYSRPR